MPPDTLPIEPPRPVALWPTACRYPVHRDRDWLSRSGAAVCGPCHPPACASVVARWLGAVEEAA